MVSLEQFGNLRLRLVAYEAQQELGQTKMKSEVKEQVSEVTDGLKELYNTASVAVGAVASRVEKLEERSAEEEAQDKGVYYISKT